MKDYRFFFLVAAHTGQFSMLSVLLWKHASGTGILGASGTDILAIGVVMGILAVISSVLTMYYICSNKGANKGATSV